MASGCIRKSSSSLFQRQACSTRLLSTGKKNRRPSSKQWLKRHVDDPYVLKAKKDGVVSRSFYKLQELDAKLNLFNRSDMKVVDLGCAPGSWSVYVSRKCVSGKLVGVDLLQLDPSSNNEIKRNLSSVDNNNLLIMEGDFIDNEVQSEIQLFLGDGADVVLSDMAPNFCGDASTDALRTMDLCMAALEFSSDFLFPRGSFIGKYFSCADELELRDTAKQYFHKVKTIKPPASRKESAERYLVATGFKGTPPG